jgi:HEAT repeat protein
VARVAGRRALPEVTAELVRLMNGENEQAAKAAAAALGVAGNEAAVEPLGRAVWGANEKIRWAALQSLGRIGSPAAGAPEARRERPPYCGERRGSPVRRQPHVMPSH